MSDKFNNDDLLNYAEIDNLIKCEFPNERALIICKKLKKYIFILDGFIYLFDKEKTIYRKNQDDYLKKDDFIISKITEYIEASIKKLTEQETRLL